MFNLPMTPKQPPRSRWLIGASAAILLVLSCAALCVCKIAMHNFATQKECYYVDGSNNHSQALDIYYDKSGDPLPLVVFIHGGAWIAGDKEQTPAVVLNRAGYACASINYRLSNQAIFPAQIYDCKAAIRWLRAHAAKYNIDPNRIGVWGASAGGHLAALLGTTGGVKWMEGTEGNQGQSSAVSAVADWCGPTDFLTFDAQAGPGNKVKANNPHDVVAKLFGGVPAQRQELARAASPVGYASADDPPFLIVHGDKDNIVPIGQSEELQQALEKAHVKSQFTKVPGQGHALFEPEIIQRTLQFFDRNLKH